VNHARKGKVAIFAARKPHLKYKTVGAILGRLHSPVKITSRFVAEMVFFGFILTFAYGVLSSVGFYLSYFIYHQCGRDLRDVCAGVSSLSDDHSHCD
jgi:hypothetical protein